MDLADDYPPAGAPGGGPRPNTRLDRRSFLARASQALSVSGSANSRVAVIRFDVDRLSDWNDRFGWSAGDRLIEAAGDLIQSAIGAHMALARVGVDEFAVLCEDAAGTAEVSALAERIRAAASFPLTGHGATVTVSAGCAVAAGPESSCYQLLEEAGVAVARAKVEGGARSCLFTADMRPRLDRSEVERRLGQAMVNGELSLYYQPVVDLHTGVTTGHEALVRWAHPEQGVVGPGQFVPVAESNGLIRPLGEWVLRQACRQARAFQERDPAWEQLTMSVNISPLQLAQPGLAEVVSSALQDSGLDPRHLYLEITESALIEENSAAGNLADLRKLGVGLAIDDFGTGYCSLAYLQRLPVDRLKIDRTFVDGLGHNQGNSSIVSAVVSLAGAFNLAVVAEGVETEKQREHLIRLGCLEAQGYLLGAPMSASDAEFALDVARATLPLTQVLSGSVVPEQPSGRHGEHVVHLFDSDRDLIERASAFLADGFSQDEAVLLIATAEHRDAIEKTLMTKGLVPARFRRLDQYLILDAHEIAALFVSGSGPDQKSFDDIIRSAVSLFGRRPGIRVFSEVSSLLWQQDLVKDSLAVESFWAGLIDRGGVSVFCAHARWSLLEHGTLTDACSLCDRHGLVLVAPSRSVARGPGAPRSIPRDPSATVAGVVTSRDAEAGLAGDSETFEILSESRRELIWCRAPEEVEQVLFKLVRRLGGDVIDAHDPRAASALPANLSVGGGQPTLPMSPPDSVARLLLERHLPAFIEDAEHTVSRVSRLDQAEWESSRDPLTGVANRRTLSRTLSGLRSGDALAILDIDHFKVINDTLGHVAGDEILKDFAALLRRVVGDRDLVGRYGGEEFLILLRSPADPAGVCARLKDEWRWRRLSAPWAVTFSAGWARVEDDVPARAALVAADSALYRAKAEGRDRALGPEREMSES